MPPTALNDHNATPFIAMTIWEHLPFDVLRCVVDSLHPSKDSGTLLNLMRVSSTLWGCAARRLYSDLALTEDQVIVLLAAGSNRELPAQQSALAPRPLNRRVRTALSFVHRLTIVGPWSQTALDVVWTVALAEHLLFPNVQQVLFNIGRSDPKLPGRFPRAREGGAFVFSTVDVCVLGSVNMNGLVELPAERYRSITCHEVNVGHMLEHILKDGDFSHCDQWSFFQSDTHRALDSAAATIEYKAGRNYPTRWDPEVPLHPLQLYLKDGAKLGERLMQWFEEDQTSRIRVVTEMSKIMEVHHFPRSGAGASPCSVCGTSSASPLLCGTIANRCSGRTWRAAELRKFDILIPSINRANGNAHSVDGRRAKPHPMSLTAPMKLRQRSRLRMRATCLPAFQKANQARASKGRGSSGHGRTEPLPSPLCCRLKHLGS